MILEKITIEEILERYTILPDEILDVLEDPNTEEIVKNICERNNIVKPEWIEIIKQLVAATLLGFIHYYDLGAEINLALNSSNSKLGKDIAQEIEAKIFANIKSLLEKNYSPPKIKDPLDLISEKLVEVSKIKTSPHESQVESWIDRQSQSLQAPKIIFETPKDVSLESTKTTPTPVLDKNNIFSSSQTESTSLVKSGSKLTSESTSTSQPSHDLYFDKKELEKKTISSEIPVETKRSQTPQSSTQSLPRPQPSLSSSTPPSPPKPVSSPPQPSPVFLYKQETITPIKSGIEISSKDIKISEVKPPPPPPKPAEIEMGIKNLNLDSKIKVVNYDEEESNVNIPKPPKSN